MRKTATLAFLLLLFPIGGGVGQEAEEPEKPLPEGVAALVHGEPITMHEFQESLVHRFSRRKDGQKALVNLVERIVVESERKRRGVEVSEDEVQEYVKKVEREVVRVSKGRNTLEGLLKERKLSWEEFLESARDFILRQKLASKDLGVKGEVSEANLLLWIDSLKQKHGVVIGGEGLPEGVHARIGDRKVTTREYGAELVDALPSSTLEGALWALAISREVRRRLGEAGADVTPKDVETALEDLRHEFREDERFKQTTFTFEQYVQAVRQMTVDELRKDPLFLAQVGLGKILRGGITGQEVKEYYDEHRDRYGEKRTFIHLLVKADERVEGPFNSRGRSLEQARTIIDVLLAKHRRGYPFEKLIKESSEDRSKYSRPDRRIEITRETQMPKTLKTAVFESPVGEVAGPIRTTYGFHLVKVLEVRPDSGFEAKRADVIRDMVMERRTKALLEIKQDPKIRLRY